MIYRHKSTKAPRAAYLYRKEHGLQDMPKWLHAEVARGTVKILRDSLLIDGQNCPDQHWIVPEEGNVWKVLEPGEFAAEYERDHQ